MATKAYFNRDNSVFLWSSSMKKELKELFMMTRRERRGTIVLLMLMAVIIIFSTIVSLRQEKTPQAQSAAQLEAFEAQTDTTVFTVDYSKRHKHVKKRHMSKRKPIKKDKPSSDKPRRLDPVPQF